LSLRASEIKERRHCEERSDEAIQQRIFGLLRAIALAMTESSHFGLLRAIALAMTESSHSGGRAQNAIDIFRHMEYHVRIAEFFVLSEE
jgi:hypothetical protein